MRIRHFIDITVANEFFIHGTDRVARVTNNVPGDYKVRKDEATYFLYDHLGNTRVAFTARDEDSVTIINALDYYSYGKILREYDNGAGDRYLITGHERDKETGLDYRGARYYDMDIARFLSLDPLAAKYPMLSAYCYVGGMPIIAIDPDGKDIVFAVSKNNDGTTVVNVTVNAKVVNESRQNLSQEQLNTYAQRISDGITSAFSKTGMAERFKDDNGNLLTGDYKINVSANISVASEENPIASTDHVFRIVDPLAIPETGKNIASWGYADEGQNYVYINSAILENTPATEGPYAGRGKTSDGKTTLERTSAHELGHSAGLVYSIYGHNNPWENNLMLQDSQPGAGMKLNIKQFHKMIDSYRNGELNKGQQEYKSN